MVEIKSLNRKKKKKKDTLRAGLATVATGSKQPQTCVLSDLLWKLQNAAIAWRERIADDGLINSDQVVSCQNGDGNLIDVSIVCYLACSPAIHTNMIFLQTSLRLPRSRLRVCRNQIRLS